MERSIILQEIKQLQKRLTDKANNPRNKKLAEQEEKQKALQKVA